MNCGSLNMTYIFSVVQQTLKYHLQDSDVALNHPKSLMYSLLQSLNSWASMDNVVGSLFVPAIFGFVVLLLRQLLVTTPRGLKLPPGPKGRLLIGSVGQLPKSDVHLAFTEWAKIYGSFFYSRSVALKVADYFAL